MDVTVSKLRANLREWVARVQAGEEVLVTERGIPVARLVGVNCAPAIERLIAEGVIGGGTPIARPKASGRRRVATSGAVGDLISEQRANS